MEEWGLASVSSTMSFYAGGYGKQEVLSPKLEVGLANKSCNLFALEMSTTVKTHKSRRPFSLAVFCA